MVNMKVWNLEGQPKSSTASPPCLKTLKVFAPKQPEADITALAVHEESWPHMSLAIGLANGSVYCMRGDIGLPLRHCLCIVCVRTAQPEWLQCDCRERQGPANYFVHATIIISYHQSKLQRSIRLTVPKSSC